MPEFYKTAAGIEIVTFPTQKADLDTGFLVDVAPNDRQPELVARIEFQYGADSVHTHLQATRQDVEAAMKGQELKLVPQSTLDDIARALVEIHMVNRGKSDRFVNPILRAMQLVDRYRQ